MFLMKVTQLDQNSKRISEKSTALSTTIYDSNCTTSLNPSDETKHTCFLNLKANKCLIWVEKNSWIWFYLIVFLELDLESIMSSLRMDLEKKWNFLQMDWDLKILIFEFYNSQEVLPLQLLIWAWNFHFCCFEKFLVGGWWVGGLRF